MEITPVAGSGDDVTIVDRNSFGFSGLNADTFMKLLIAQLWNQDPLDPVGGDQPLSQIATMRNLQSNIELSEAMKAITTNQQLSTAASFIGKAVSGDGTGPNAVSGVVDRAFLREGEAFVGIGDAELPLENVTSVNLQASGFLTTRRSFYPARIRP